MARQLTIDSEREAIASAIEEGATELSAQAWLVVVRAVVPVVYSVIYPRGSEAKIFARLIA